MQKIYYQYRADDDTFSLNIRSLGLIPPGRYRGYEFEATNNLLLKLVHTTTGYTYPNTSLVLSNKIGAVVTQQGCIVAEDAAIELPIAANNTANPRIDLVVLSHEYKLIVGGLSAEYFVIQGTAAATPVAPALTDTLKQVIIGTLYLPAGTTSLTALGVLWTPAPIPEFGNDTIKQRLQEVLQSFSTLQQNFTELYEIITTQQTDLDTTLNSFQTIINNTIAAQQQYIEDHVVEFRNNGTMLQWKYVFEGSTAWRDLGVALMMHPYGVGVIEVHIAGNEPLPVQIGDRNILEFASIIQDNEGVWALKREYIATQSKTYNFVLDTLKFTTLADFLLPNPLANYVIVDVIYFEIWKNYVKQETKKVCMVWSGVAPVVVPTGTVRDIEQMTFSADLQAGDKLLIQCYLPDANEAFSDNFYDPFRGNINVGVTNGNDTTGFNQRQSLINERYALTSGHLYTI